MCPLILKIVFFLDLFAANLRSLILLHLLSDENRD